jgi:hypothetical protein
VADRALEFHRPLNVDSLSAAAKFTVGLYKFRPGGLGRGQFLIDDDALPVQLLLDIAQTIPSAVGGVPGG